MKKSNKESDEKVIRIIDKNEQILLKSFSFANIEEAYRYYNEMQSFGIEVAIEAPSINQTLFNCLSNNKEDWDDFAQSLEDEISSH